MESSELIDATVELLVERIPGEADSAVALAKAYLLRLPPSVTPDPEVLAAEVASLFAFVRERRDSVQVRVLNPEREVEGYSTSGTVVEVNVADSPFLLDSVTNELRAHGLEVASVVHPVIGVERDDEGTLIAVRHARHTTNRESVQHYVLDRTLEPEQLALIEDHVHRIVTEVRRAVSDFHQMLARVDRMIDLAGVAVSLYPDADVQEAVAFLDWLKDDNFVFLGYREYRLIGTDEERAVQVVPGSGLGILSEESQSASAEPLRLSTLPPELAERYERGDLLVITKTNRLSPVHRRTQMDYVGVRIIGPDGVTTGEARMIGLFTSKAYMEPAAQTPVIRRKLASIVSELDLIEGSHDHKALVELLEGFSKHDLFASPLEELATTLTGLLAEEQRNKVRLFVRRDLLERSVHVLVAMPRDRFNPDLRRRLQELFMNRFHGRTVDYHLALGNADPAQVHFTIWVENSSIPEISFHELENEVVALTRSWTDQVRDVLLQRMDRSTAERLADTWANRFPEYYTASVSPEVAAGDIACLERLAASERTELVGIQNEPEHEQHQRVTRIALYRQVGKLPLNVLLPALVSLGLEVVEEVPTRLSGEGEFFIHDFGVLGPGHLLIDPGDDAERLRATVEGAWFGTAESDDLDRLVIIGGLGPSQVEVLRAYRTYWRRVSPVFTVGYVNDTLVAHAAITAKLVRYFEARFDPGSQGVDVARLREEIVEDLDAIPSLEEDRILRSFLRLMDATLRTNAFKPDRGALAFKFRSSEVPEAPRPHPMAEIFVVAPTMEGIHLRGGMVARGGIRWSTRREDYRTEVLGLMKAQMTKNAVIVPTGAKGGFVLRRPPDDPVELRAEVERRYSMFIDALLDLTDDRVGDRVVGPPHVVTHDNADPYLVVAADKGTATFSDTANRIATERGFWLGDAFASGGSTGYDHKALGITARGAWRSLERHFREMGVDPYRDEFTAVGIGDMSGDVFGNGMLESSTIRLVAAFDHRHIFLDPDPDAATGHAERKRLYELPRSSWDDYDRSLISKGGGVYPRTLKRIELSEEVRSVLGTDIEAMTPNELIRVVLTAPVDLLWNGGIGTYVKASWESNDDAGDRTNDPVRVDGTDLRCRVVVEGGNLGLTQAGRIEYAEHGGRINTDFIDNSGGVDCSDREVNLKILLDDARAEHGFDETERNRLIASVAEDVVDKILYDNFLQAQMLSEELDSSHRRMDGYENMMCRLEELGMLDRAVEGLPSSEQMNERARSGAGLCRPELAVLLAYAKRAIEQAIIESDLPADPYLESDLRGYFPKSVVDRFGEVVSRHPLRRELIATLLANDVVNSEGVVFVSRLADQTGADPSEVVAAYRVARDVSQAVERWEAIEDLFGVVEMGVYERLMRSSGRAVASLTRWYLGRVGHVGSLADLVERYRPGFREMREQAFEVGPQAWRDDRTATMDELVSLGVPEDLARSQAALAVVPYGGDVIEVAGECGRSVTDTLDIFLRVGEAVGLDMLTALARRIELRTRWQRLALWAVEEELLAVRRLGAERALELAGDRSGVDAVDHLLEVRRVQLSRVSRFLEGLDLELDEDVAPLMVAIRQVRRALS